MGDSFDKSVTEWIDDLKRGDTDAAYHLWTRYFHRLTRVAARQLEAVPRRVADEEDVAVSSFHALCRGAAEGRFTQLTTRDDLWHLLVAITAKKAVDHIRHERRQKRGGGDVRGDSVFRNPRRDAPADFDQMLLDEPSPSFLCMLEEQHDRLLAVLRDDLLRQVAIFRLEGYRNKEIADRLNISHRSVERKLKLIREEWSKEIER